MRLRAGGRTGAEAKPPSGGGDKGRKTAVKANKYLSALRTAQRTADEAKRAERILI